MTTRVVLFHNSDSSFINSIKWQKLLMLLLKDIENIELISIQLKTLRLVSYIPLALKLGKKNLQFNVAHAFK